MHAGHKQTQVNSLMSSVVCYQPNMYSMALPITPSDLRGVAVSGSRIYKDKNRHEQYSDKNTGFIRNQIGRTRKQ